MGVAIRWILTALCAVLALLFCLGGAITFYAAFIANCVHSADCKDLGSVVRIFTPITIALGAAALALYAALRSTLPK